MDLVATLRELHSEAVTSDQRRLVALCGDRSRSLAILRTYFADEDGSAWPFLGEAEGPWETLAPRRGDRLLGHTVPGLIVDATTALYPNTLGQAVGAVEGGGLVVMLLPDLEAWVAGPLDTDARYAVEPYSPTDVGTRFRRRFVETLEAHRGVAVLDVDAGEVRTAGRIEATPPVASDATTTASDDDVDVLSRCLTADQRRCVRHLLDLVDDRVLVVEAHRGRGKSSAAGLAAVARAEAGDDVIVTGPGFDRVREAFRRAGDVVGRDLSSDRRLTTAAGGTVRYVAPANLEEDRADADLILVDEAAALPVHRLERVLETDLPCAFLSTVHGYEGTGRGFAVRFRDRLEASDRPVDRVDLREPIRYAPGDPVETWLFHALLLDAAPPAAELVRTATPANVTYRRVDRDELLGDEPLLAELFGLLVLAHYRTEPDDLVRLLDAPNVRVRAMMHDGHVVAVALLAEEGNLPTGWRRRLHRGEAIRGHMVPDLLTTQLRDREAAAPAGWRILRIATHDAVRSRGIGSALLAAVREEADGEVDYLSTGFGATPRLLSFWRDTGFHTVHLATSRNPRSGEHSAVMLAPLSPAGARLADRHTRRLLDRLEGQLPDALDDLAPETVVAAAAAIDGSIDVDLVDWLWDVIRHTADGPGQVTTAPHAYRRLALAGLLDGHVADLPEVQRTLLVRRILQGHDWATVVETSGCTAGDARQALQAAIQHLADRYDPDAAD